MLTSIISSNPVATLSDAGEAESNLFVGGVAPGAGDDRQITVVLNGIIYDAVVSDNARSVEAEASELAHATLADGDYTVAADASDVAGSRRSLLVTSAENNVVASLTLVRYSTGELSNGRLSLSLGIAPDLPEIEGSHYNNGSLAEPGLARVTHSTRESASTRAKLTIRNSVGCMVVPSNIVLTPRVLLGALEKLPTHDIEDTVERLLAMLDSRSGDSDLEVDADFEVDVDEQSDQAV